MERFINGTFSLIEYMLIQSKYLSYYNETFNKDLVGTG
jgi:hypothetical protein